MSAALLLLKTQSYIRLPGPLTITFQAILKIPDSDFRFFKRKHNESIMSSPIFEDLNNKK